MCGYMGGCIEPQPPGQVELSGDRDGHRSPSATLWRRSSSCRSPMEKRQNQNYQIRGLLLEFTGVRLERNSMHEQVSKVPGALMMDSRGIYDAATRNVSALHGLRESRAGYELTIAVINAVKAKTSLRWVCGLAQLADSLTKANDRKTFLQFLAQKQYWRLVDDETFTAGRKVNKRRLEQKAAEKEELFISWVQTQAAKHGWPWLDEPVQYHPFD